MRRVVCRRCGRSFQPREKDRYVECEKCGKAACRRCARIIELPKPADPWDMNALFSGRRRIYCFYCAAEHEIAYAGEAGS